MRILHTADWHLGHVLYGHDRSADHRIALAHLERLVAEYQPDVMAVSGDIFHTSQPSAASTQLLAETLVALRKAAPDMRIVLTAGNHDSPSRHEVFRLPWQVLGVTVVGRPPFDDNDYERFIVAVDGKGFVLALPYIHPRGLSDDFFKNLYSAVAERNSEGLPVVTMAHAAITGCDAKGHEDWNVDVIGGLEASSADDFGVGYDYMALGHIHHAQTLSTDDESVRYAGSLIPVSFAEDYPHSVSIVEIERHGDSPVVNEVLLETGRNLRTYGDKEGATPEAIEEGFADFAKECAKGDFVRINLKISSDKPIPAALNQYVNTVCESNGLLLCGFNVVRNSTPAAAFAATLTGDELERLAPSELLEIYASQRQIEMDDDMRALFKKIADQQMSLSSENED